MNSWTRIISGITFSGGDPLYEANRADVTALAKEIKERYPKKISGFTPDMSGNPSDLN